MATSLFSGNCTVSGFEDGFSAKFYFTWSVVKDAVNDSLILVADYGNNAICTVRKYDGLVETFVESWKLNWVGSLTQEPATGDIYASAHDLLYLISYSAKNHIKLNGQSAYSSATYINGPLQKAQFSYPNEFLMVASKIVMVSDKRNLKVRMVDLVAGNASTVHLCGGKPNCSLKGLSALMLTGDSLYVGMNRVIHRFKSEFNCN